MGKLSTLNTNQRLEDEKNTTEIDRNSTEF